MHYRILSDRMFLINFIMASMTKGWNNTYNYCSVIREYYLLRIVFLISFLLSSFNLLSQEVTSVNIAKWKEFELNTLATDGLRGDIYLAVDSSGGLINKLNSMILDSLHVRPYSEEKQSYLGLSQMIIMEPDTISDRYNELVSLYSPDYVWTNYVRIGNILSYSWNENYKNVTHDQVNIDLSSLRIFHFDSLFTPERRKVLNILLQDYTEIHKKDIWKNRLSILYESIGDLAMSEGDALSDTTYSFENVKDSLTLSDFSYLEADSIVFNVKVTDHNFHIIQVYDNGKKDEAARYTSFIKISYSFFCPYIDKKSHLYSSFRKLCE